MDAQTRYVSLGRLIEAAPNLVGTGNYSPEIIQWLSRGYALVAASKDISEANFFRNFMNEAIDAYSLVYSDRRIGLSKQIMAILYRQLALAELEAPAAVQGAFIPAGNALDAMAAFSKVANRATQDLLIIDPYMDEKTLTDFAPTAHEGVSIRLLADAHYVKATFGPAVSRWLAQYGSKRPLSARLATAKTLHDRLLLIDVKEVWIITQSLNAIAERSPASIVRVEGDTSSDKIAAYQDIWSKSPPLT